MRWAAKCMLMTTVLTLQKTGSQKNVHSSQITEI